MKIEKVSKWGFAGKIKNGLMCAFARKEKK